MKKNLLTLFTIEQLIVARIHIGNQVKFWYSQNFSLIKGYRDGVFILNLDLFIFNFRICLNLIEKVSFNGLTLCFILQNQFLRARVTGDLEVYLKHGMTFLAKSWMPGFISNFKNFFVHTLTDLQVFFRNSKKRRKFLYSIKKNKRYYAYRGLRGCRMMPSLLVFFTPQLNNYGVDECFDKMIPTCSLYDSNISLINKFTYSIPANVDSKYGLVFSFLAARNSFLIGLLKKRSHFLFVINNVLRFLRTNKIYFFFRKFVFIYFFFFSFVSYIV